MSEMTDIDLNVRVNLGWQRTRDNLPPPDERVLTWDAKRGFCIGDWSERPGLKPGRYWTINGASGGIGSSIEVKPPTHWQLLPLPPGRPPNK